MIKTQSYPMKDEPERKSHAANILSNNLSLSNCTFLAISLSVYLLAFLSNISKVTLSYRLSRLYRRGTHLNRLLSVPVYREFALIPAFTGGDFPLD